MTMTDPIADMLTRIRNAVRIERPVVPDEYSMSVDSRRSGSGSLGWAATASS